MNNKLARTIGISTIVLLAGAGVAGCTTTVNDSKSPQSSNSAPSQEQTKEHTKADVAASVDGFFAAVSEETKAAIANGNIEGTDNLSESEANDLFKTGYPKSFGYMADEVSDDDAVKLIGSFSLAHMFAGGEVVITATEDKIDLHGNEAHISGEDLNLTIDGQEDPHGEGSSGAGSIDLKYIDGEWKFSSFDMGGTEE